MSFRWKRSSMLQESAEKSVHYPSTLLPPPRWQHADFIPTPRQGTTSTAFDIADSPALTISAWGLVSEAKVPMPISANTRLRGVPAENTPRFLHAGCVAAMQAEQLLLMMAT
jgi:hypothetical protein